MDWSAITNNKKKIIAIIAVIVVVIILLILGIAIYTIAFTKKPSDELVSMVDSINSML